MGHQTAELETASLFQQFAGQEVEFGGFKGTIEQLVEFCPVPAEQRSPEAMERFTAKILFESGVEIPEEFTYLVEREQEPKPEPEQEQISERNSEVQQIRSFKVADDAETSQSKPILIEQVRKLSKPAEEIAQDLVAQQAEQHVFQQHIANLQTEVSKTPVDEMPKTPTSPEPIPAQNTRDTAETPIPTRPIEITPSQQAPVTTDEIVIRARPIFEENAEEQTLLPIAQTVSADVETPTLASTATPTTQFEEISAAPFSDGTDEYAEQMDLWSIDIESEPQLESEIPSNEILSLAVHEIFGAEEKETTVTPAKITQNIVLHVEVDQEQADQTESFVQIMPEEVQETLLTFLETVKPEEAEPVQKLVVEIAELAEELHELAMTDMLDSEEAELIQEQIIEMYTELLQKLEIEVDKKIIMELIETICSEEYKVEVSKIDQFREMLQQAPQLDLKKASRKLANMAHAMQIELARLMIQNA